jgi:DNA segregation ATPase FtsK/SpoIIIE, S-DNA-T family
LADLLLDGIRISAARGIDLSEWCRAMREGRCEIDLKGVSHVFVPTSTDADDPTISTEVPAITPSPLHADIQQIVRYPIRAGSRRRST